jgi:hypothetical protein
MSRFSAALNQLAAIFEGRRSDVVAVQEIEEGKSTPLPRAAGERFDRISVEGREYRVSLDTPSPSPPRKGEGGPS